MEGEMRPPLVRELSPWPPPLRPADQPLTKRRKALGLQWTGVCGVSHLLLVSCVIHLAQSIRNHQTKKL